MGIRGSGLVGLPECDSSGITARQPPLDRYGADRTLVNTHKKLFQDPSRSMGFQPVEGFWFMLLA
jgi:hypothetical protein